MSKDPYQQHEVNIEGIYILINHLHLKNKKLKTTLHTQ